MKSATVLSRKVDTSILLHQPHQSVKTSMNSLRGAVLLSATASSILIHLIGVLFSWAVTVKTVKVKRMEVSRIFFIMIILHCPSGVLPGEKLPVIQLRLQLHIWRVAGNLQYRR